MNKTEIDRIAVHAAKVVAADYSREQLLELLGHVTSVACGLLEVCGGEFRDDNDIVKAWVDSYSAEIARQCAKYEKHKTR